MLDSLAMIPWDSPESDSQHLGHRHMPCLAFKTVVGGDLNSGLNVFMTRIYLPIPRRVIVYNHVMNVSECAIVMQFLVLGFQAIEG